MELIPSFLAVCLIALTHVLAAWPGFFRHDRHKLLSVAGGAAVAYVFVYVLPKLSKQSHVVVDALGQGFLGFTSLHVYGVAMLGLIAYFGVSRLTDMTEENALYRQPPIPVEWAVRLHVASFAAYSLLVGFIIASLGKPRIELIGLATLALMLHFLGNDYHLAQKYQQAYRRVIRWVLAASVLAGWLIGTLAKVSATTVAYGFAFLSGAIIINTLREELPHEAHASFWLFLGGALGYSILILLIIRAKG